MPHPFLKWAGGKRQLLPEILKHVPKSFDVYYEPFVGAGAVLFALLPLKAVIGDTNEELINCYQVIRSMPEELIAHLAQHQNEAEYFYALRNTPHTASSPVQRASRTIYLNKTCFNGLYHVNSKGQFNVPFGRYANPKICDEDNLRAVHQYLTKNKVIILNTDFAVTLTYASAGDFVYLDPPYHPLSDTASFTGYTAGGFGEAEQRRLKDVFDELTRRGVKALLSNSATPFILDLYRDYDPIIVSANRAINSKGNGRGGVPEVLVRNY